MKSWIYVKRGLITPYHYEKMGNRIWLFLYILDRADWKTGMIDFWTDDIACSETGIKIDNMRKQRQGLAKAGYIKCILRKHHQSIIINNYINPHSYSREVINVV